MALSNQELGVLPDSRMWVFPPFMPNLVNPAPMLSPIPPQHPVTHGVAAHPARTQMVYFVRDPSKFVTRDNVGTVVFFGVMRNNDTLHSLLKIMHGLYVPVVVANTSWPETVKSDFTAQMHKFMANLTETVYEIKGKTILYIPQVGSGSGPRFGGLSVVRDLCLLREAWA